MNSFLLHLLIREIRDGLAGRRIRCIRYLRPLVVVDLGRRSTPGYLVIVRSDPGPFCFLGPVDPVGELGGEVFARIHGTRLAAAPRIPVDRRLDLPLAGDITFSISLFGSAAKLHLENAGGTVIESLDPRETGTPVRARAAVNPESAFSTMPRAALESALRDGRPVPGLDAELLEVFGGARTGADISRLADFRDALAAGRIPFRLGTRGRLGRVAPLPDATSDRPGDDRALHRFGPFARAEAGCLEVGDRLVGIARAAILRREAAPVRKRLDARRRLQEKLRAQLDEARRFDAGRNEANILAAYRTRIAPGAARVELPDLYTPGKTIAIDLDPALPLDVQIDKRFKRASKLERSRAVLTTRIARIEEELAALGRILDASGIAPFHEAVPALRNTRARFARPPAAARSPRASETPPTYRRFALGSGWFAVVGRNDRENDEITFHFARPDDLWMHAQHVPGSHVVIKSDGAGGNPPQSVLEAAAAIAAFFSKARHAGLVPVIYTRRKYVRKLRGGRPGQVTCEREKTLFAEPRLPAAPPR